MKHEIAQSRQYAAVCTCGHIARSTMRLAALTYLMDHIEAAEKEEA